MKNLTRRIRALMLSAAVALGIGMPSGALADDAGPAPGSVVHADTAPDTPEEAPELPADAPQAAPEDAGAPAEGAGESGAESARGPLPDEPTGIAERTYQAVQGGKWREVAALGVLVVTLLLRRWDWLRGQIKEAVGDDRGGVLIAVSVAALGALVHTWWAGASFGDLELWKTVGIVAIEAMGVFVGVKKLFRPAD